MERILLWDIDGTLIHSVKTGGYKEYTIPVLEEVFGTSGRLAEMRVSGMTDLQIVYEALNDAGISREEILARADVLVSRLTEEARRVTGNGVKFFEVLPGVRETLQALADHPRYESALVTGNIKPMAELKMELVGLDQFFTLPGAFGDESHNRRDLPARAAHNVVHTLRRGGNARSNQRRTVIGQRATSRPGAEASPRARRSHGRQCARASRAHVRVRTHPQSGRVPAIQRGRARAPRAAP